MNLNKKKQLAIRTLGMGKKRIIFNKERLAEIKEAITRQDIKDLLKDNAIKIGEITGKRKKVVRKTRRREGSIKKKVNVRKKEYMIMVRKLRSYIFELKKHDTINPEEYSKLRKEIRSRVYKSKAQIRDKINKMILERK
jgi:large subunit ribosomal protein L19e